MREERAIVDLAAHHLRLVFQAEGMTVLKIEIPLLGHMSETVRATYEVWLYDQSGHEAGDYDRPTLRWEKGVAHFVREAMDPRGWLVYPFVPKPDGWWKHNYNAVSDSGEYYADSAHLDKDVANQWKLLAGSSPNL